MGKIKKHIVVQSSADRDMMMSINIQVDVNAEGEFTTTLSSADAETIKSYGVELKDNRVHRPGFFKSDTMAGLISQIKQIMELCLNYKVVSEVPVIRYYIYTFCSYCLNNQTGEVVPNGRVDFVGEGGCNWKSGNYEPSGWDPKDFGIRVYVKPYMKKTIEYGNGVKKVFYNRYYKWEKGSYMEWLNELCGMSIMGNDLKEIEGTEENARFFVNVIKQICRINESIGDILKNDKLQELIQSTLKLEIL